MSFGLFIPEIHFFGQGLFFLPPKALNNIDRGHGSVNIVYRAYTQSSLMSSECKGRGRCIVAHKRAVPDWWSLPSENILYEALALNVKGWRKVIVDPHLDSDQH